MDTTDICAKSGKKYKKLVDQEKRLKNETSFVTYSPTARGAARIFLRGGAEVMEAKALKRKSCL